MLKSIFFIVLTQVKSNIFM